MNLREYKTIFIDNKEVKKIKVLNNTVWSKETIKSAVLTLSASSLTVTSGNTFNLIATITDKNGQLIDGEIEFSCNGQTKSVQTNNGIALWQNISIIEPNSYQCTAKFINNQYQEVEKTITITIVKDTPSIEIFGDTTIYDTWDVKGKITYHDIPLTDADIIIKNNNTILDTVATDNNGIFTYTIDTDIVKGENTFSFYYDNEILKTQSYTIKEYEIAKIPLSSYENEYDGVEWNLVNNSLYCGTDHRSQCPHNNVINIRGRTGNTAGGVILSFNNRINNNIKKIQLLCQTHSVMPCSNSEYGNGGLFPTFPMVYYNDVLGSNIKFFDTITNENNMVYSDKRTYSQTIEWNVDSLDNIVNIRIKKTSNQGNYFGSLKISSIILAILYIPEQ